MLQTVKGLSIVNEAQLDVLFFFFFSWNYLAFLMIQIMLAIWSLVPLHFLNPACTYGSSLLCIVEAWII